jgi:ankyrin repeat protein
MATNGLVDYDPGRLMLAVRNNSTTMARELLRKLPDAALLNLTDDWGYTPLHIAAEENKTDICRLLLAASANIRIKDAFGNTALHHAASGGSLDVAELLVSRKAPLDVRNDAGNTALHLAASRVS